MSATKENTGTVWCWCNRRNRWRVAQNLNGAWVKVPALHRNAAKVSAEMPALEWIQGDAMNAEDVRAAAEGEWGSSFMRSIRPVTRLGTPGAADARQHHKSARQAAARIVLPGTIYIRSRTLSQFFVRIHRSGPLTKKGTDSQGNGGPAESCL